MTEMPAGREMVLSEVWFPEKTLKTLLGAKGTETKRKIPFATQ